ncbi:MAG: iron transporter [Gammaproteobacteria bacterium]|nr:MAG: iron transporter [Gammaproteobacteria bacterium]RKZ42865.1 MAG: iron transporter [Gammaproteobacteria bacterium]RKZ74386.1 MAG: iron transporter [Gammaproteobacteria bacterium]
MTNKLLSIIGPGILVAATGVGAGDLATASFTGAKVGLVVLWAVVLGAFFKFVLTEGLARWQLATGTTILEGAMRHFGRPVQYGFLIYFLAWSFMVAAALMSACGAAAQAILPLSDNPATGKIIYGIIHSLIGLGLIYRGGYQLFEKVMSVCIALMFITVITTAIFLQPDWHEVMNGLLFPNIFQADWEEFAWTIALIGGVGGTVTILSYGYWIREKGRLSPKDLPLCRLDLAIGYIMTALFGIAMMIIGNHIHVEGGGASLIIILAEMLVGELGLIGKWAFLIGAWVAIFSSLLGVWQGVPYLFADLWRLIQTDDNPNQSAIDTNSKLYRGYLYALSIVPMLGLWIGFANMQKFYAIIGALFLPMLALTLLRLNGQSIGSQYRNHPLTTVILIFILFFFLIAAGLTLKKVL